MAYSNTNMTGTGTFNHLVSEANQGMLKVTLCWTPSLQSNETLDSSNKTFTVPASTEWRVKWIWVELTTTATGGNRQLEIQILDGAADVIAQVRAGAVQGNSVTRYYLFAPHVTELGGFRDTDYLSTIMPEWILPATYVIRVWDNKEIDKDGVAGDDMIVQMMVETRSV